MEREGEREKETDFFFLLGVSLGFTNHSISSNIATDQEYF